VTFDLLLPHACPYKNIPAFQFSVQFPARGRYGSTSNKYRSRALQVLLQRANKKDICFSSRSGRNKIEEKGGGVHPATAVGKLYGLFGK